MDKGSEESARLKADVDPQKEKRIKADVDPQKEMSTSRWTPLQSEASRFWCLAAKWAGPAHAGPLPLFRI